MQSISNLYVLFWASLLCLATPLAANDLSAEAEKTKEIILNNLNRWPLDFNKKNVEATCDLFASDLIATYPGAPDKDYEGMCRQLRISMTNPNINFQYEKPKIEQIILKDDLAVVRLIWTLKRIDGETNKTEVIRERGLDVFKKQKDGSWKISISYAYPIED